LKSVPFVEVAVDEQPRDGCPQQKKRSAYWMARHEDGSSRLCCVCRWRTMGDSMVLHLCLPFFLMTPSRAAHRPLVPRPQQIQDGSGRLALKSMAISFGSSPTPEDRFAVNELASKLGKIIAGPSGNTASSIVFNRTGAVDALPGRDDRPGPDSRESYTVHISDKSVEVRAPSAAGCYYAAQTIQQLVDAVAGEKFLPEVDLQDWPALAYRGFMMDTRHGPLPTEGEINRQINFLARSKANQYYLYSEASIELRGYPLINPGARYTESQIRSLVPSPWFHVGMDEPWELEKAGSKAAGGVEPGKLYIEQLKSVTTLVRHFGKLPMFWADVNSGARRPHT
jgi:hypothetical protein